MHDDKSVVNSGPVIEVENEKGKNILQIADNVSMQYIKLPSGTVYYVLNVIGRGATAIVYRVIHEKTRQHYALKVISLTKSKSEENMPRETESLLGNPVQELDMMKLMAASIWAVHCIENLVLENDVFILMEFGDIDLATLLKKEPRPLHLHWIKYYFWQMVEGIHALHEAGILHCDIKPSNFVLIHGRLRCIDFGISKYINYMSPEALHGMTPYLDIGNHQIYIMIGTPSDVWSLGVILYEMLYGKTPFGHIDNIKQRVQAIVHQDIILESDVSNAFKSDEDQRMMEKLVMSFLKRSVADRISIDALLESIRSL